MPSDFSQPTRRERFAAASVDVLQRAGLRRLAYSDLMRRLGKRFLLREGLTPQTRVIASGVGKGLKLCVLPETPGSYWLGAHEPDMQRVLREKINQE
jgi:hypothetical protein